MKIAAEISRKNPPLSRAELLRTTNGKQIDRTKRYIILKTNQQNFNQLAYTKNIYKIKNQANTHQTIVTQTKIQHQHPYKITYADTPSKKYIHQYANQIKAPVNLDNPQKTYHLLKTNQAYFTKKIWTNNEDFTQRYPHKRPQFYPNTLHPKFARSLVNLAQPQTTILDPFCGAGGILIEAGTINKKVKGFDIKPTMTDACKKNLHHFNIQNHEIQTKNALHHNKTEECVVTDLPYGKATNIQTNLKNLFSTFLKKYGNLTTKLVVCSPKHIEKNLHTWHVKDRIYQYENNSLTREILNLRPPKTAENSHK